MQLTVLFTLIKDTQHYIVCYAHMHILNLMIRNFMLILVSPVDKSSMNTIALSDKDVDLAGMCIWFGN